MNKAFIAMTAAAALVGGVAIAQPAESGAHMERMANHLELTDLQKAQMKNIHEKYQPQFQALRQQMQAEVDGVLTAEQKAKAAEMRAKRGERAQNGRKHRGE